MVLTSLRSLFRPLLWATAATVISSAPLAAQGSGACPAPVTAAVESAWRLFRVDSMAAARSRFARALQSCPGLPDAAVGMGFVSFRAGEMNAADSLFRGVANRDSTNADAWEGIAMVAERRGQTSASVAATRRVLAIAPRYESAVTRLSRLAPDDGRPQINRAARRNATLHLTMRTQGDLFELRDGNSWRPFFVRGVNMGVALPGKFPSEFPKDSALYARWFSQIAAMNANTMRLYTILPPQFYRALRGWNISNPARPLYIVHGVWTELPPDDDFDNAEFVAGFREETRKVVDLLHGAADFPPRPGHAGGRYDADVSQWTIGYITGREWESVSLVTYLEKARGERHYDGRFLSLVRGTAIDAWMTAQCDYMLAYEADTYNALRPIAYTNWPTTDPLIHPSEASPAEEMKFRGQRLASEPGAVPLHYEDALSLDANLVKPTAANAAGWFVSYHVYPYYPDFILYDAEYSRSSSSLGPSNYFGYLKDLKRHHAGIPLMVAEFSVPTSRGLAHLQPQGWNHGGSNEVEAATINARLAAEIREAGAAGEIFFAWIDEWFKANWFSADFEIPAENRRQWLNILSPEQHYGVIAVRPGAAEKTPLPGGDAARWRALPVLQRGALFGRGDTTTMRVGSDEGFVYLALETKALAGRPFLWDTLRLQLGLDTYRPELGQMLLPVSGLLSEVGFEFLLDIRGPTDAQLKVSPDYNPYAQAQIATGSESFAEHFQRTVLSRTRSDGKFDSLFALTNRPRYTRAGTFIPGSGVNAGRLTYGRASENSLADWFHDASAGMLQIRLPWGMLNVSDPSTASILYASDTVLALKQSDDCSPCSGFVGVPSDGFRLAAVALGLESNVAGSIPAVSESGRLVAPSFVTWRWAKWEQPTWHEYVKPTYGALRDLWGRWK